MDSPPDLGICSRAVASAAAARRQRARNDARNCRLTPAALEERIVGIVAVPRRGRDGWWLVGVVLDDVDPEGGQFDVWCLETPNAAPRLGLSRREASMSSEPPPTPSRYFCGLTLRWIDANEKAEARD